MAGQDGREAETGDEPRPHVPLALERVAAAAAMAALCLITLANVIVRYLTDYSFAFTEEISVALMVVVALLGAAIAAARNGHVRIGWFVDQAPRSLRGSLDLIAMLATLLAFAGLTVLGGLLVLDEYRFGVTSPGLGAPQWIYTAALPLFALLVAARTAGAFLRRRRCRGRGRRRGP